MMQKRQQSPIGYSMPSTAPLYTSPPVIYNESRLLSVLLQTEPGVLQHLVPPPLQPNPEHLLLLNVNLLQSVQFGPYNEVTFAIPSRFQASIGQYCFLLWVDDEAAIAAGREIWGFPKKQADISVHIAQQTYTITVHRKRQHLLSVTMELGPSVPVEQLAQHPYAAWLNLQTWFNHKRIPSVTNDTRPAVDQLTSTTMRPLNLLDIHTGQATVVAHQVLTGPLQLLERAHVVGSFAIRASGTLPHGEVLFDYLSQ